MSLTHKILPGVNGLPDRHYYTQGSPGAELGIIACHGHSMKAVDFARKFTPSQAFHVLPQALKAASDNAEAWIQIRSLVKFSQYPQLTGVEDNQFIEAIIAAHPNVDVWALFGFSGGAGFTRDWLRTRALPFSAIGLSHNGAFGPDPINGLPAELQADGTFGVFPGNTVSPVFFEWGTSDPFHPDGLEDATAAWAKTIGTTLKRRRNIVICGKTVDHRVYNDADYDVLVIQGGGHSLLDCAGSGSDHRFETFVRARLGL